MVLSYCTAYLEHVLDFAKTWHGEQKRKYTGEPYWHHLVEVANILTTEYSSWDEETLVILSALALLHDVLEDTKCTEEDLRRIVSERVIIDLKSLDDSKFIGNRKERKEQYVAQLSTASFSAKTTKIADLISNTASISEHDQAFAKVYLVEKERTLEVLKCTLNENLWNRAFAQLQDAQRKLYNTGF